MDELELEAYLRNEASNIIEVLEIWEQEHGNLGPKSQQLKDALEEYLYSS